MLKKIISIIAVLSFFLCFLFVPAAAVISWGTISTIVDFVTTSSSVYEELEPLLEQLSNLSHDVKIERQSYCIAYWSQLVKSSYLSEEDFRAYYAEVIASDGTTIDGVNYYESYAFIQETAASGLSLDTLCTAIFTDTIGSGVDEEGQPYISGTAYNVIVTNNPSPISTHDYISYHNDLLNDNIQLTLYHTGSFGIPSFNLRTGYIVPFCKDANGKLYFSPVEFHFRQVTGDKDPDTGLRPLTLEYAYIEPTGENVWSEYTSLGSLSTARYVTLCFGSYGIDVNGWSTLAGYCNQNVLQRSFSSSITFSNLSDVSYPLTCYNLTDGTSYSAASMGNIGSSDSRDYGFYISDKPFLFELPTLADNTLVYPSTTNIYNWYIDDPADDKSGDTIYNYITNNYIYPDNPTTEDNGEDDPSVGSGTTSGDITVGGRVEVGGEIVITTNPIDINVNVNNGSTSTGTSEAGVEFDEDVSLNNYFDWLLAQTSGFREFMSVIFGFMPVPIVTLLCAGFAAVILSRFVGR